MWCVCVCGGVFVCVCVCGYVCARAHISMGVLVYSIDFSALLLYAPGVDLLTCSERAPLA